MFTAAGQTLPQQYTSGGQANRKNKFINNAFHELHRPLVFIRILQNKSTSSDFTSSKNQPTAQSSQIELFSKELAQTDKRSYVSACSKRLRNPFHFAAKGIKATKFESLNQRSLGPNGSGGPGHVEEGCQFLSSLFLVKRDGNSPVVKLKDLNSSISYQHFKMDRFFLLKDMLLPGAKIY